MFLRAVFKQSVNSERKLRNALISMESLPDPPRNLSTRHKCVACFKQFKRKEHLVEHMKIAYHSVHQPRCPVCQKHCKSFESVREHLNGPLAKGNCASVFSEQGCDLCLGIFYSVDALREHKETCCLFKPVRPGAELENSSYGSSNGSVPIAVSMDCEMVGGGDDGSLDLCARVCLVDEDEKIIFDTYVQPTSPVTNYRHEVTGLTEDHFKDAMLLKDVQEKVMEILYSGPSGRFLVAGHDLGHDMDCLRIKYPSDLLRDTAKYRPLMKTNLVSQSLKYLTKTYLGYKIQSETHDPYEDCVSAMRLYKRMRELDHHDIAGKVHGLNPANGINSRKQRDLEKMSPEELYEISTSDYRCWCMDRSIQ